MINKRFIAIIASMSLIIALMMCSCGTDSASTSGLIVEHDGVTYTLSSDWTYDEENAQFTKTGSDNCYDIVTDTDLYGDCTNAADRAGKYDPSEGIETQTITVNGEDAVLTVEPVNEVEDMYVYFYKDGKEHAIHYEYNYGDEPYSDEVKELLDSIS